MRTTRTEQPSVFQTPQIDHTVGDELEVASLLLDQHPELLDMVGRCVGGSATCGRIGLTCETILRSAVIARLMDLSYRDLEFVLRDSQQPTSGRVWNAKHKGAAPARYRSGAPRPLSRASRDRTTPQVHMWHSDGASRVATTS